MQTRVSCSKRPYAALLAAVTWLALATCSDDPETVPQLCYPGSESICTCADTRPGTKRCNTDGLSYGECRCTTLFGVDGGQPSPPVGDATVSPVDAAADAEAPRADASTDAGTDASADAGSDASGADAGSDATDAGRDAGSDAGADAATDAGSDAGRSDAGARPDASATDLGSTPGDDRRDFTACSPGSSCDLRTLSCCYAGTNDLACRTPSACTNPGALCDGPEDCLVGERCCVFVGFNPRSYCATTCDRAEPTACHTNTDCSNNSTCMQTQNIGLCS